MKVPKNVTLIKASYIGGYKYQFEFSNGVVNETDFEPFISFGESLKKFLDVSKFSKMKFTDNGDIYWGKDWDMCFHIHSYYKESKVIPLTQKQ